MGAALAACLAGLLGAVGGLVWIVAGVWTVRRVWGATPGIAWGLACLAAGFRWGTLGLGDLQAATRLLGPTVSVGPAVVAVGASVVLGAALLEEARGAGLRSRVIPERIAAGVALLALVAGFVAPGWGVPGPWVSFAWWGAAGLGLAIVVLVVEPVARRLPGWLPAVIAVGGVVVIGVGR